jgi:hypothetical protein
MYANTLGIRTLTTPDPAKIQIRLAILIHEARRVNTEAPLNRLWLWFKRAFRSVALGNSNTEHTVLVSRWEEEIVSGVLVSCIWSPELLSCPRNIF